jgi:hypothetical protein
MLIFPSRLVHIPPQGPAQFPGLTTTYLNKVMATGPLALWTLGDASGLVATEYVNGWNGTYSNVTLGQTGIGDGSTAASFNGTTSYCNLYSAALAAAFNGAAGTIAQWLKVSGAGVWADGVLRRPYYLTTASTNNRVLLNKPVEANQFSFNYIAGGVNRGFTQTGFSTVAWFLAALSWDYAANAAIASINGIQVGATLAGLGVWAGALVQTTVGAQSPASSFWDGYVGPSMVWTTALPLATLVSLATVP